MSQAAVAIAPRLRDDQLALAVVAAPSIAAAAKAAGCCTRTLRRRLRDPAFRRRLDRLRGELHERTLAAPADRLAAAGAHELSVAGQ
jgi:hypothetical protein